MHIPNLLLSLFSLSPILTRAAVISDRSTDDLFQLTPDTFKSSLASGHWFIEHFSPSCPHCRHFEPTWEKLIDEAKTEFPDVRLAQVNCALYGDLCNENGVTGYPTIILYNSGHVVEEYEGDRELPELKEFLHEHIDGVGSVEPGGKSEEVLESPSHSSSPLVLNPHGKVISLTPSTFQTALSQGPMFVKFFTPWCGHCKRLAPTWAKLAKTTQNARVTTVEVNCDKHRVSCREYKYPTIPFIRKEEREEKNTEYKSGRKLELLSKKLVRRR